MSSTQQEDSGSDSPERKAVWQSPKKTSGTVSSSSPGSSTKIKGFLRHWKERKDNDGHSKAQEVVDLLKGFQGPAMPNAKPLSGSGPEDLSFDQAAMLQGLVNQLQNFSQSFVDSPQGSQNDNNANIVELEPNTNVYVDLVAKEMEEIMALHRAGLLDLDDFEAPEDESQKELNLGIVKRERKESNKNEKDNADDDDDDDGPLLIRSNTNPEVINEELLALNALMESGWWDEPSQSTAKKSRLEFSSPKLLPSRFSSFTRLMILEVRGFSTYLDSLNVECQQLCLSACTEDFKDPCEILLRKNWIVGIEATPFNVGDIVHFIGSFENSVGVVDSDQNFIVVHPDKLIRITSISDAYSCRRRSVLSEKLKIHSDRAEMLFGTMVHSLFEACVGSNNYSDDFTEQQAQLIVQGNIARLYGVDATEGEATTRLREAIPRLRDWAKLFMTPSDKKKDLFVAFEGNDRVRIRFSKVLEVEQSILCPMWGMTGTVDLVVQAHFDDGASVVCPLELKTGNTTADKAGPMGHRAQVTLYTLLLQQFYNCEIEAGLLFYSHNLITLGVRARREDLMGLVGQRNAIAYHLSHVKLPELLQAEYFCKTCSQNEACFLYHKAVEGGTEESSGCRQKFRDFTGHLAESDLSFYRKWDSLTRLELSTDDGNRAEIWTLPSAVRELKGTCFSKMTIVPGGIESGRGNRHETTIRFQKLDSGSALRALNEGKSAFTLTRVGLSVGDRVVLSTEDGCYGIMSGFISDLTDTVVAVRVRGPLQLPPLRKESTNDFHGLVDIEDLVIRDKRDLAPSVSWRLDSDSLTTQVGVYNRSLTWLMRPEHAKLRSLIVDLKTPRFSRPFLGSQASMKESQLSQPENAAEAGLLKQMESTLNIFQLRAVENALNMQDYSLVLGVPGSGKTATMAWIVTMLVRRGQTVLVTGMTHNSVDSLLRKVRALQVDLIRLAPNPESVHEEIRPFCVTDHGKTVAEFRFLLETAMVVGCTCTQIKHSMFDKRKLDVCIVDEATQITVPAVLGPLRCADRFILVGDHYQLPPFSRNSDAREGGMGQSLFTILNEAHFGAVSMLEYQYRMNSDIMSICNALVYNLKLRCGNEEVARSMISWDQENQRGPLEPWVTRVCEPTNRVVFLDTDEAELGEDETGRTNAAEARVVYEITHALVAGGISVGEIGVISPYRAQVAFLEDFFAAQNLATVEVNTIDRCQGRDWDVVLLSLVKSNDAKLIGELLTDWKRLNVALSRAKRKLVIIGDAATLSAVPMLQEMLAHCTKYGWIQRLPPKAK